MENNNALDGMIAAKQEKLDRIDRKIGSLNKQRNVLKSEIEKCELMKNSQQLNVISNVLNGKGISIEDIIAAASTGDFLALQDKVNGIESKGEETTHAGAESEV